MLENTRIAGKIGVVITLLAVVAAVGSITGVVGMSLISSEANQMQTASDDLALSAAMNQSLLVINRSEYRLGLAPEEVGSVKKIVAESSKVFEDSSARLAQQVSGDRRQQLDGIIKDYAEYRKAAQVTIDAAEKARNIAMGSSAGEIIKQLKISLALSSALSEKVQAISAQISEESIRLGEEVGHRATMMIAIVATISILGIGVGVVIGSMIGKRGLTHPIESVVNVLRELAVGHLDVAIPGIERKDEVGDIGRAALVFRDGAKEAASLRLKQEQEQQQRALWAAKIEDLTKSFDTEAAGVIDAVAKSASQMQSTAGSMSTDAEQTTERADRAANAAYQATSNVQTVAAASEELTASIQEIARQVLESSRVSDHAVSEADRTTGIVEGLERSARKISEIVSLISDIAAQTNLLALNATIEAASAGDAGKGFAVVANEVKGLANQTAKATDEIEAQVAEVQAATSEAVSAIKSITEIIRQINVISGSISSAIDEQGAATQEIASNAVAAVSGTSEVNDNIDGVSKAAVDTGHSAHDVLVAATDLARDAERLRGTVGNFLSAVRGA